MTETIERRAWVEQIMGLPISVHVRGREPWRAEPCVQAVFAGLRHADAVFSPFRHDSDLSRWERGELAVADADPDLAEVLALCEEAVDRTGGWFDPRALPGAGGGTRYDPSGLVKGWAVQQAARHLPADREWCLNAGGDILVNTPYGCPPWRIGIEDPDDPARVLRVVTRDGGAVATSGTAHRGAHIIDPYTGRPATSVRAVTVIGPDLLWADVYATAAAARGPSAIGWIDGVDGYEALLVTASGRIQATDGWPRG